jgi:hypothetical protein
MPGRPGAVLLALALLAHAARAQVPAVAAPAPAPAAAAAVPGAVDVAGIIGSEEGGAGSGQAPTPRPACCAALAGINFSSNLPTLLVNTRGGAINNATKAWQTASLCTCGVPGEPPGGRASRRGGGWERGLQRRPPRHAQPRTAAPANADGTSPHARCHTAARLATSALSGSHVPS